MMKNEKGFVLIITLLFLMSLSLLGVSIIGETALEERMASNTEQQVVALNASESALAVCEGIVQGWGSLPTFDPTNEVDGLHIPSSTSIEVSAQDSPVWDTIDIIVYDAVEAPLYGVDEQPVCIIEHLTTATETVGGITITKELFRISAEGTGGTPSALAYTQSIVTRQF